MCLTLNSTCECAVSMTQEISQNSYVATDVFGCLQRVAIADLHQIAEARRVEGGASPRHLDRL
jgi:hypothetical protein